MINNNNEIRNLSKDLIDTVRGVMEAKQTNKHGHDVVGKETADIDNDGDTDNSDKYLHNRRNAISKAKGTTPSQLKRKIQAARAKLMQNKAIEEDAESLEELSKPLLGRYIKKAATDAANKGMEHGTKKAERDEVDRMTNRHMSFGAKDLIHSTMKTTNDRVEKPREQAGKRIAGINMAVKKLTKEEVELDEAMNAVDRFNHHHGAAKDLLKSISQHLATHAEAAKTSKDYQGKKGPNWGHVGTMENIKNQLGTIHDQLARTGEYANTAMKEEVESVLSEEEIASIDAIYADFEDETIDEARGRPRKKPLAPSEQEEPEPRQHIMQQLQRAKLSMQGSAKVKFKDGTTHDIHGRHAAALLDKYAGMKPHEKEDFQKIIGQSHEGLKSKL